MDQDPSQVRAEVEDAREELGETVEALAAKVNAPRRIKDDATAKAQAAKQQAQQHVQNAKERLAPELGSTTTSMRSRLEPAVSVVRSHPKAAAAAAIGLLTGIVVGRVSR